MSSGPRRWSAAIAGLLACAGAHAADDAAAVWSARVKGVTHTVAIDGTAYMPALLTVKRGDTVSWINKDPFPHTVTARAGAFDSKTIAAGKAWRYVARHAGDFPYFCTLHPTMTGTLKVE